VVGLRDCALIGVMTYAFERIGAVVAMKVEDYSLPCLSVHRAGRCRVRKLRDGIGDQAPSRGAVVIAVGSELIGARIAFLERLLAIALEHEVGGTPDIDLGYHVGKTAGLQSSND
jgi:hypothetical protein